ncbi:MAG: 4-hydroxythreonine-4-phosphate dehydrogenase PdxA [Kiritimatiellia bacterium]
MGPAGRARARTGPRPDPRRRRPRRHALGGAGDGCLRDGVFDGVVTAPICREGLRKAGIGSPAYGFIAALCGASQYAMILRGGGLTVSLATRHIPLRDVAGAVTAAAIRDAALPLHALLRDLGVRRPRIAVCGLNPHAGDGGVLGDEDLRVIKPAVAALRRSGMDASGPHAGDTVFWHARAGRYDGVVAMYHDQGLAPLKLVGFADGVNITAGLRIVRTSPDHGTAFDIAGRGRASAASMTAAVGTAFQLARRRRSP